MAGKPIEILLVEDNPTDARLVREYLGQTYGGPSRWLEGRRVRLAWRENLAGGLERVAANNEPPLDAILLDLTLPDSCGLDTFSQVHAQAPNTAIILFTSRQDESLASQALRLGAQDYLLKGGTNRDLLIRAVLYAIDRKRAALERERLIMDLQKALANVRILSGLLPICAHCKRVRDDRGYWSQIETFISTHSEATFSHGLCPECARQYFPDFVFKEIKDPAQPRLI